MFKKIDLKDYIKVTIPDTWNTIEEFTDWYMNNGMLFIPPWDAEVICSDDATAMTIFRKDRYQVELYLVHPDKLVPMHAHPGMESLLISLGGGEQGSPDEFGVSSRWGEYSAVLREGETHGDRQVGYSPKGYAMLTFQKWNGNNKLTSAAIQWRGETAGPLQDALIKKHNPNALTFPGYADITIKSAKEIL